MSSIPAFPARAARVSWPRAPGPPVKSSQSKPLPSSLVVLSATQGSQISTSSNSTDHGLLKYYYLKALNDGNTDIDDISNYLKPRVEDEARSLNVNQSPSLQGGL